MSQMKEIPWDKTCTDLPQKWHEPRGPSIQPEPVMKLNFAKASTDVGKERKRKPVDCTLYEARTAASKEHNCDSLKSRNILLQRRKFHFHTCFPLKLMKYAAPNLVLSQLAQC